MTAPVGPELLAFAVERVPVEGHDGRSGALLERVRLGDGTRLVVKRTCRRTDLTMQLLGDPGPLVGALTSRGTTLTHGDLWLVNTAFEAGHVTLLDWGLAAAAPGAFDFATLRWWVAQARHALDLGAF